MEKSCASGKNSRPGATTPTRNHARQPRRAGAGSNRRCPSSHAVRMSSVKYAGAGQFTFDTETKKLDWTVEYADLSGPAAAAHLHGPADPGQNAEVAVPFEGELASPIKGSATLTDAQAADLQAGKYYVNIHTEANKGGEIRGQVTKSAM